MKHWEWALLAAFVISFWSCGFSAFSQNCAAVREDTLRLHILANSDSDEDQQLKLMVRDQILTETADLFTANTDHASAVKAAEEALPEMLAAARTLLQEQGCDAPVTGDVIPLYFETRQYETVTLPAGVYDAVQIRIGEAKGKNWWCVLFPPLCVGAAMAEPEALPEETAETLNEIQTLSVEFVPKFAAIEWLERLSQKRKG